MGREVMRLITKKVSTKAGLPPGSLIHVGDRKIENTRIRLIEYDENNFEEKELSSVKQCFAYKDTSKVTWLNIDGLHDVDIINNIGEEFGLHPLVLEDILNTEQRPKMDDFEDYLFIVAKMLCYDTDEHQIIFEQVSFVLGKNYVISFQESGGGVFETVSERLRKGKGRIRRPGADYLLYSLMDAFVDNYYFVLENIGERVAELEDRLINDPDTGTLASIHDFKRELIFLRKSVWPLRELIGSLERGESNLIHEKTGVFFKDLYDHVIQVIDTVETYRDIVSGMIELFFSSVSSRMNEVMKVLTLIATIFIPLTFIAGIYGMNFEYMPELKWLWGYPIALFIMSFIGVFMLIWFRRKRFL
jgi:magnesium transporter